MHLSSQVKLLINSFSLEFFFYFGYQTPTQVEVRSEIETYQTNVHKLSQKLKKCFFSLQSWFINDFNLSIPLAGDASNY